MAVTDLRQTVLQIVNKVQEKIGVNQTALDATKGAKIYLQLLNEVVGECADDGDWLELFTTHIVTAQSSVAEYTIDASALVHHVMDIRFGTSRSSLNVVRMDDMRRLQAKPSYGTPHQMAMTGVDTTGQPKFSAWPIPVTAKEFNIGFYEKPPLYTTSDAAVVPPFPANVLITGLYAKALLDENGGEQTKQWQVAYQEHLKLRNEARNRFTSNTGTSIQFRPSR